MRKTKHRKTEKEQVVTHIFVSDKTDLATEYFTPQCHHAGALFNSSIFVQRNTMSAMGKAPGLRSSNEIEVLARLDEIQPRYRETRIRSLTKSIAKSRREGEMPKKDIEKIQYEYSRTSLYAPGKWLLGYGVLDALFKWEKNEHYKTLHSHVAQNTLEEAADAFDTFVDNNANYKVNPEKYNGRPKVPGYMDPGSMRTIVFSAGDCKIEELEVDEKCAKAKCLVFPKTKKKQFIEVGELFEVGDKVGEVRVKPVGHGFDVQIVRNVEYPEVVEDNGKYSGGDLGLENLITITSNVEGINPLIVDGRELKSINQYFNKKIAEAKSRLPAGVYTSREIQELYAKRDRQIKCVLGFAARLCAVYLHALGISLFAIGKNNGWKQSFKCSKKTIQSFAFIPYEYFLGCLERRCREVGIRVEFTEESYTSKASLSDLDEMPVWNGEHRDSHDTKFSGRRRGRGRYFDSKGRCFNADVNGSGNILRKVVPSAFDHVSDFKYLMNPKRVRLGVFSGDGMNIQRCLWAI